MRMIKEFTVGVKHVVNMGGYESLHIEASVTISVEEDDTWETTRQQAQEALTTLLRESYKQQTRSTIGLPKRAAS